MYYTSTTTNSKPAKSALTSTSVPSQTNAGTYYVWYYVKGDNSHSDTEVQGPVAVTIKKKTVSDWSISPTTMSLNTGKTGTITVNYGSGSSSDHGTVSYSSSATAKATVSSGTVKAVAAGSVTITVTIADGTNYTYSGSKTCAVTVTGPLPQRGVVIQDPDLADYIKVYTSATSGYRISKTNTSTNVTWSNNSSWGSKQQWTAIFSACGGSGYSALNSKASGISGWSAMSNTYWSCTEIDSEDAWYFGGSGWYDFYGKDHKFNVRTVYTFTD